MADIEKLKQTIVSAKKSFEVALTPETKLSFAQESGFAMQILKANDYLSKLDPDSIRDSIIQVALVGLTLNPALKYAYLIPRGGKCTLDISYIGMIKILTDAGFIKNIDAAVVYEKDEFEFVRGSEPYLRHVQKFQSVKMLGAYAIAYFREGGYQAEFLSIDEIGKIKATSESLKKPETAKYSPWNNWESEMMKKTVLKRLFKLLPKKNLSENLIAMLSNEHQNEMNDLSSENKNQSYDDLFDDYEPIPTDAKKSEPSQKNLNEIFPKEKPAN